MWGLINPDPCSNMDIFIALCFSMSVCGWESFISPNNTFPAVPVESDKSDPIMFSVVICPLYEFRPSLYLV